MYENLFKQWTDSVSTMQQDFQRNGFARGFAGMNGLGAMPEQFEKARVDMLRNFEQFASFAKDNGEAFMTASTILAKGCEGIAKAWLAFCQEVATTGASTTKQLIGAKTLREAVDLQADFAKTSFDRMVAEGTKVSEMSLKVANEAIEPINQRVNLAVEKFLKPAA
jgi:phasin family protein